MLLASASLLESTGAILTIVTPLIAVPLTVITFYLRSLREHQVSWHSVLVRRVEQVEAAVADLRKTINEFERDYATKEEWLRECMLARRSIEHLRETAVRIETTVQSIVQERARAVRINPSPSQGEGMGEGHPKIR
jgi:predicted RNase H-like nuclease (RuvC/YqgF family)